MRLKPLSFIAAVLLTTLGVIAFASSARAISISPTTFDLSANPGDTVTNVIRVYNDQPARVLFNVDVEDFTPAGESGQVVIQDTPTESFSLQSWVTVEPLQFVIEPQSFRSIEFTIKVPLAAEPGGHYGSILFTSGGSGSAGSIGVAQKVGALLLLNVAGEVSEKMYIAEFSAPSFSEYGPVTLTARFKNDGTVHLKPRGFVTIANSFGREVSRLDLPQYNVLPGMIRKIEVPWGQKYLWGRYTATLSTIYGSANEPVSAVVRFWVIPWKIAGSIGIVIILFLWILIRGRRRLKAALRVLAKGQ